MKRELGEEHIGHRSNRRSCPLWLEEWVLQQDPEDSRDGGKEAGKEERQVGSFFGHNDLYHKRKLRAMGTVTQISSSNFETLEAWAVIAKATKSLGSAKSDDLKSYKQCGLAFILRDIG